MTAILRPTEPDGRGRAELALVSPMRCAEETDAARRVLESGALAQADEVAAFEQEFSDALVLDRPCVAVNSGTSGLHLGLLAAGIGPGDEVIVPSFTFAATANAVALTGARPVFADIEPDTFCLSPDATAAAITARTAAIMPVHLFGHPADLPRLSALAARHGLALFEDAAQAHGASMNGVPVGSVGRFAMFSFYATKNMTSGGEGGMVSCADRELERSLRLLRNQGMVQRYRNEVVGPELPNVGAARGPRPGPVGPAARNGTTDAGATRNGSPPGYLPRSRRPSGRVRCTSTTSTRSAFRAGATSWRPRCASSSASVAARSIPSRSTSCRLSGSILIYPRPPARPPRCCRCRSGHMSPTPMPIGSCTQ